MATRLLLALLALLTGLAAQMSPAQARIRADGASEIRMVTSVRSERVAVARPRPAIPVARQGRRLPDCSVLMLRKVAECAPPVMLGIDRARE
jgi:hypothetical protein